MPTAKEITMGRLTKPFSMARVIAAIFGLGAIVFSLISAASVTSGYSETTDRYQVMISGLDQANALCGDLNGDGEISVVDAIRGLKIIAGSAQASDTNVSVGDLNGDKVFNVLDVIISLKHVVGLVSPLEECATGPGDIPPETGDPPGDQDTGDERKVGDQRVQTVRQVEHLIAATAHLLAVERTVIVDSLRRDGATLAQVIERHGTTTEAVIEFATRELRADLAHAVEAGRITADEAKERIAQVTRMLTGLANEPGILKVFETYRPEPSEREQLAHQVEHLIAATAHFLAVERTVIVDSLRHDGVTLAQVIERHGTTTAAVVEFATRELKADLAHAVEAGRITDEEAKERVAHVTRLLTRLANEPGILKVFETDRPRPSEHEELARQIEHLIAATARVLAVERSVIVDSLRHDGVTLAQVIERHGTTTAAVIEFATREVRTDLARAVESGRVSDQEAKERIAHFTRRLTGLANEPGMLKVFETDIPETPDPLGPASLGHPFRLPLHADIRVDRLVLSFDEVLEDSRCPADVTCIRAGRAVILLKVDFDSAGFTPVELQLGEIGKDEATWIVGEYGIRLEALDPYPVMKSDSDPSYIATIVVVRTE